MAIDLKKPMKDTEPKLFMGSSFKTPIINSDKSAEIKILSGLIDNEDRFLAEKYKYKELHHGFLHNLIT